MKPFNVNTVLLAILLGLSGWTLFMVHGLAVAQASIEQRLTSHDRELAEIKVRILSAEAALVELKILQAKAGIP